MFCHNVNSFLAVDVGCCCGAVHAPPSFGLRPHCGGHELTIDTKVTTFLHFPAFQCPLFKVQQVENVSGLNELHIKFKIEEVLKRGVWGQACVVPNYEGGYSAIVTYYVKKKNI